MKSIAVLFLPSVSSRCSLVFTLVFLPTRHMKALSLLTTMQLVLAALVVLLAASASTSTKQQQFITCTSIKSDNVTVLPQLQQLQPTHVRVYLNWNYIQPVITSLENITVAGLRANTSWIEPFISAAGNGWALVDSQVSLLLSANITPIIEIGEGTLWCLPQYAPATDATAQKHQHDDNDNDNDASSSSTNASRYERDLDTEILLAKLQQQLGTSRDTMHHMLARLLVSPVKFSTHQHQEAQSSRATPTQQQPFDPNIIGEQLYLAYLYRYARASVHRYKDRVSLWQIENELNEAYFTAVIGWRMFPPVLQSQNSWGNWTFLTQIIETLKLAVQDEQQQQAPPASAPLQALHNFHTDIPEHIHELFHVPGFYLDAVADWQQYLDVVAFDAYPNYVVASPNYGSVVGQRAANIRNVSDLAATKPVMVMETGFPVANSSTPPYPVNYTDAGQSSYMTSAFKSLQAAGGTGFCVFGTWPNSGFNAPPGGYTQQDLKAINLVQGVYQTGDLAPLLRWLLIPGTLPWAAPTNMREFSRSITFTLKLIIIIISDIANLLALADASRKPQVRRNQTARGPVGGRERLGHPVRQSIASTGLHDLATTLCLGQTRAIAASCSQVPAPAAGAGELHWLYISNSRLPYTHISPFIRTTTNDDSKHTYRNEL